ncbi:MAG: SDR family NAD(P)-dependent oxidoreductase [Dehalococcoidales bacterium]|jgi:NAD(P)-dependent dehydrogenase (short-subunit alcohol dehydrogenase family)
MTKDNIFDLSGKTALITGASRGLGRAFAIAMAQYGADVACVGRDTDKLAETLEILAEYKHRAIAIKADVTDEAEIKKMVADAVKRLGKIDIFFNNAGIARMPRPIHETPTEEWDAVINTNLRGAFLSLKHVLGAMVKQKSGSIINISSIAGLRAEWPEVAPAAYGAAKAGIILLTQVAAMEYAKDNIRVNCIAPGMHKSELGHNNPGPKLNLEEMEKGIAKYCADEIPMGRIAEASELAGLAILLASDASSYITGQVFVEDGGQSARL